MNISEALMENKSHIKTKKNDKNKSGVLVYVMSRIYGTLSLGFSLVLSMFMSSSLFFFAIQQGKDTGQDI